MPDTITLEMKDGVWEYFDEIEEVVNIAEQICTIRAKEGLTQKQLADRIGTTVSSISRIENFEYTGHSVQTLRRIASAFGKSLKIAFVDRAERKEKNEQTYYSAKAVRIEVGAHGLTEPPKSGQFKDQEMYEKRVVTKSKPRMTKQEFDKLEEAAA